MYQAVLDKLREVKRKSLLGQLVVLLLAAQLLLFSSFVGLSLPTPTRRNLVSYSHNEAVKLVANLPPRWQNKVLERAPELAGNIGEVRMSLYVPQAPVAIFIGYTLGSFLGPLATLLFVICGLLGPTVGIYPFAGGGGLDYYHQPGFGYLLGLILASWCAGKLTFKKRSSFRQALAILSGLLAVHAIGLLYLLGICLFTVFLDSAHGPLEWQQWLFEEIRNLSWYALPYDLVFSMLLVGLGFPFRWLVNILTAPDVTGKIKHSPRLEELV